MRADGALRAAHVACTARGANGPPAALPLVCTCRQTRPRPQVHLRMHELMVSFWSMRSKRCRSARLPLHGRATGSGGAPESRAASRSSSTTCSPRAALMNAAPRLRRSSSGAATKPRVASVSGSRHTSASVSGSTSATRSTVTFRMPCCDSPSFAVSGRRDTVHTSYPAARRQAVTHRWLPVFHSTRRRPIINPGQPHLSHGRPVRPITLVMTRPMKQLQSAGGSFLSSRRGHPGSFALLWLLKQACRRRLLPAELRAC